MRPSDQWDPGQLEGIKPGLPNRKAGRDGKHLPGCWGDGWPKGSPLVCTHPAPQRSKTQIINKFIFYSLYKTSQPMKIKFAKGKVTLGTSEARRLAHHDLHYAQVSPDGREVPGAGPFDSVKRTPLPSGRRGKAQGWRPAEQLTPGGCQAPAIPRLATRGQHHPGRRSSSAAAGWGGPKVKCGSPQGSPARQGPCTPWASLGPRVSGAALGRRDGNRGAGAGPPAGV